MLQSELGRAESQIAAFSPPFMDVSGFTTKEYEDERNLATKHARGSAAFQLRARDASLFREAPSFATKKREAPAAGGYFFFGWRLRR